MTRLVTFAVAIGMLSACTTEDITPDVCGNGIVEAGEDCDTPDTATCQSCGIVCGQTEDCEAYDPEGTRGFVCGPDGFCHAPSGQFAEAGSDAMPVTSFFVTDVTQDGIGDVVVQSQTSITAVSGLGGDGSLQRLSIQTPIARGNAAPAFVDADASLDLLLPTADGIVAYTSQFAVPAPFPFPELAPNGTLGTPLFVHPFAIGELAIIGIDPNDKLIVILLNVVTPLPTPPNAQICNANKGDLATSDISVYETSPRNLIIAMTLRPPAQPTRLCIVRIVNNTILEPSPPQIVPTSRPVLANLRNTATPGACPSLVIAQGPVVEFKPVSAGGPCAFDTPALGFDLPVGVKPVASAPLVPQLRRAGVDHTVALVMTDGVYAIEPQATGSIARQIYVSDRELESAQTVDIDRDGDLDVIASGVGSDDLDILDRRDAFDLLRFRFDTQLPVTRFLIGDFDGNEIADIAYVELDQLLSIAYGTSDQLLPGVTVGTFFNVLSVIPTPIRDSTDPDNLITDLAVLFQDVPVPLPGAPADQAPVSPTNLSLLHGSPQRTMLSFFDPREAPPPPGSEFRGVVSGFFSDSSSGNDLVAFEQLLSQTNVYLSSSALDGSFTMESPPVGNDGITLCGSTPDGETAGVNQICIEDARYLTWPKSVSPARDMVLVIDTSFRMIAFDPTDVDLEGKIKIAGPWKIDGPTESVVTDIQRVADPAGTPRLLISFGPKSASAPDARATGVVKLCTLDDLVAGPQCENVDDLINARMEFRVVCVDAGVARVARAARFEPPDHDGADLVVLCRIQLPGDSQDPMTGIGAFSDVLMRVSFDGSIVQRIDALLQPADELQIGDVSGDGIDDLVLVDRSSATLPLIRVLRQCNSRELVCGGLFATGMKE